MKSRHAARLKIRPQSPELEQSEQVLSFHESATFSFINTELDLAETFFDLATNAGTRERRQRNLDNAQRAYSSALRFAGAIDGDHAEVQQIQQKLDRVKTKLDSLGKPKIRIVPGKS